MKKIFSMLLVAAMLVAMLPCFAVGASAEDAVAVVAATAVNPDDPWASAWAGGTSSVSGDMYAQGGTTAKLEYATVIDRLEIVSGYWGGRAGGASKLWGSVDGETWEALTTLALPGGKGTAGTSYTFEISSKQAYNYVKIVGSSGNWDRAIMNFTLYGAKCDLDDVAVSYTQTKIDDTAWSVRFLSTVDKAAVDANTYSKVGYNITATGTGITDKSWTNLESDIVYTGVYEMVEGSNEPVLTAAPEGFYFHLVTIADISLEDYEDVTFAITPYAVLSDGETCLYGAPKTIAFVDGVFVAE